MLQRLQAPGRDESLGRDTRSTAIARGWWSMGRYPDDPAGRINQPRASREQSKRRQQITRLNGVRLLVLGSATSVIVIFFRHLLLRLGFPGPALILDSIALVPVPRRPPVLVAVLVLRGRALNILSRPVVASQESAYAKRVAPGGLAVEHLGAVAGRVRALGRLAVRVISQTAAAARVRIVHVDLGSVHLTVTVFRHHNANFVSQTRTKNQKKKPDRDQS